MPVVWATQVLESLLKEGRASRAEVTDAAMGQRAVATRQPVVTPIIGRFSKQPNLIFAVPILNPQGEIVAVVCGSEKLDRQSHFHLAEFVSSPEVGGFDVVAPREKVIATSTDPQRILKPVAGDPVEVSASMEGFRESADTSGEAPTMSPADTSRWCGCCAFSAATAPAK